MHTIFLADDETWVLIHLRKLIEKSGMPFKVIGEANNGVAALAEVERKKPDVLITDIRMPGHNGLELMEKMNERNLNTTVVFLSGYSDFNYAQSACRLRAFDYLLKPIGLDDLSGLLSRLSMSLSTNSESAVDGQEEEMDDVGSSTIKQIVEEIRSSYISELSLTELSKKHAISIGYLSQRLKNELGLSFVDYISSMRIQRAKELLRNEHISVDDIARQVGYRDCSYFIKVFKKIVGMSPHKYRKGL
ncbi:MAG: response regulator [Clostridiales bacterium]|nr:response regulator [Clostridiales bacterium]